MLKEILKKESLDESDIKIIMNHIRLLSESDLIRLGLKQPLETEPVVDTVTEEVVDTVTEEVVEEVKPKKKITK